MEKKGFPSLLAFRLDLYLLLFFLTDVHTWLSICLLPSQFSLSSSSSSSWPCCWGPASVTLECCHGPFQKKPRSSRWKSVSHRNGFRNILSLYPVYLFSDPPQLWSPQYFPPKPGFKSFSITVNIHDRIIKIIIYYIRCYLLAV